MNIAIFTDTYVPIIDGVVTYLVQLSRGLAKSGHKIYIIAPKCKSKESELSFPNIEVKRINSVNVFFYEDYKLANPFSVKLLKYIIDKKIDIIHMHTPFMIGLQAISIAKFLRLPLLGTFHTHISHPDYLKHMKLNHKVFQKIAWEYCYMYYKRCDLITFPTEYSKNEFLKNNKSKKLKVKVVPHGYNEELVHHGTATRTKNKYNPDGKLLIHVSRIAYEKNIPYFLDVFRIAIKSLPSMKLLIVGGGPQEKKIKALVNTMNLSDKVIFTGRVANKVLAEMYAAADLFVSASTSEMGPVSFLEAQANGTVCMALNKGGQVEFIKNNVNGLLMPVNNKRAYANSIVNLLTDDALYTRMKTATIKEIKIHSPEKVVELWKKVYADLKSTRKSRFKINKKLLSTIMNKIKNNGFSKSIRKNLLAEAKAKPNSSRRKLLE